VGGVEGGREVQKMGGTWKLRGVPGVEGVQEEVGGDGS
jgi:hypothetical protein